MLSHLLIPLLGLVQQEPPKPATPPSRPPAVAPAKPAGARPVQPAVPPAGRGEKPIQPEAAGTDPAAPVLTKEQAAARLLGAEALKLFKANRIPQALELAGKALDLDPGYELGARVLGWCAVATGDDRKAEAVLTRALNMNPADGELQFLLAGCHKRLEEWGAARDLLTDLVKREGPTVRVLIEMGECCLGAEDHAAALEVLESARKLDPKSRDVVERIVDVHESKEDWVRAAAELRALVQRFPTEGPLRYRLAQDLLNDDKVAEAAGELEEAARVLVEDPQPHKLLEAIYSGPFPNEQRLAHHRNWLKEWNLRRR